MSSSQNITLGPSIPAVVNPESIPVDWIRKRIWNRSQQEQWPSQKQIEEAVQANLLWPMSTLKRSGRSGKQGRNRSGRQGGGRAEAEEVQKEEEAWKAEVEEERRRKKRRTRQSGLRPEEAVGSKFVNLFDICQKLIDSRCCGKEGGEEGLVGVY